ncbi:MAG: glycosyltransferase family 4 protein [Dehalococcoidia bacterium]|nr:glycosyltransferase family 4 protein [Dehalococcoidia bacterium]
MKTKICILTSVHLPFDTRIFHKQAKTLAKAGYEVTLIAQHDRNETVDGIKIVALPRPRNRLWRMLGTWRIFKLALKQKADVYHFHDPELLPTGALLKLFTKRKIVYDVHENIQGDISTKSWLPKATRRPISMAYKLIEKISLPFIDKVIIAEESYKKLYIKYNNIILLRNYPVLSLAQPSLIAKNKRPTIVYVGLISEKRGALELVESVRLLKRKNKDVLLNLAGFFQPTSLEAKMRNLLKRLRLNENINLLGYIKHDEIYNILSRCQIGLAIMYPEPNCIESLPTKLFEYMAAGLPLITSNFPLWKKIVEGNNCGLTVNPANSREIARAVEYLIEHPVEAKRMGEKGRKAVLEKYNWDSESKKLLDLYEDLLKRQHKQ